MEKKLERGADAFDVKNLLPLRPTMGDDCPVLLWRLIRMVGLPKLLAEDAPLAIYLMGKDIGKTLKIKNIEDLASKLTELKIGKIILSGMTKDYLRVEIGECLTCSGIAPVAGAPVCHLETGIIAGILEGLYPDRKIIGEEIKCIGGLGDDICLIECRII